jgi:hypothetical protein
MRFDNYLKDRKVYINRDCDLMKYRISTTVMELLRLRLNENQENYKSGMKYFKKLSKVRKRPT